MLLRLEKGFRTSSVSEELSLSGPGDVQLTELKDTA